MPMLLGLLLAGSLTDLVRGVRQTELDPQECYRVRELSLSKGDARFYLTDGHIIFGKPVAADRPGTRITAVFATNIEGGDAEVLVLPPIRSERRSLASYIGSPNLNERFQTAVFLFSDDTYAALVEQMRANPFNKRSTEVGLLLAEKWNPVVRNISGSFETRLLLDLISGDPKRGFFTTALSSKQLGNFDVLHDPDTREQIVVGQVTSRDNRPFFDVWTSFETRASRKQTRQPAVPEFALKDYRIEATLEPDLNLRVVTRVKVVPPGDGMRALPFDIGSQMRVSGAFVDGRPAEILRCDSVRSNLIRKTGNELFLVVPEQPLQTGREYELEFRHDGKVVFDAGNRVYYVGARANWYPNRGMQFAIYDLTFRFPKDLDLVTTGEVIEERTDGEWRVTRRRTTTPIRLAGFNLGVYDRARVSRAGYNVEVCANQTIEAALQPKPRDPVPMPSPAPWPRQRRPQILAWPAEPAPNPRSRLQELASDIASAIGFMAERFGPPPLRSLTVSPVPGTFGQGFPGLIYLSTLSYLGRQEKPLASMNERQQAFFSQILVFHEAAHQWWGNVVTSSGYHDSWLMEALANYSALMFLEKTKGARRLESALEEYRNNLLDKKESGDTLESTGPIVLGERLETSLAPHAWRTIVYGKGSWIIHMLRRNLGDERFQAMLYQLRRRFERKAITTEEFRDLAAEFLPPKSPDPKLDVFFDQWVYGTGIPSLKLNYAVRGKAPALRLVGKLTQSDVDPDFSVLIPIEIQLGRGKALTQWVRSSSEPVLFTVPVPLVPAKVSLDPSMRILRR